MYFYYVMSGQGMLISVDDGKIFIDLRLIVNSYITFVDKYMLTLSKGIDLC
jgi:hypothetical protein